VLSCVHKAATKVQQFLPHGWIANFTGWRLPPQKSTGLKMRANSVRKLEKAVGLAERVDRPRL
jgi:hypothetical protein